MFRKKLWVLAATACALALGGMLACTPLVSTALARRSPRIATVLGPRLSQLRSPRSQQRAVAARRHTVSPHLTKIGVRPRIVGGSDAAPGDWAFMAFVAHFDPLGNPDFTCSGTVIAPNVVLTAGHCALDATTGAPLDPSGFGVVTGSLDWTNQSQRQISPVSQVIVDPAYDPVADTSDAALLVLSTPSTAPAIPLATSANQPLEQAGTPALTAGWGDTYNGDPNLQTYLQWARTVVQRPGYCSGHDGYFDASSQLCAVNPPQLSTGTCNGDSGGPMIAYDASGQLIQIGIITQGPTDCNTYTADYFTSTNSLADWLAAIGFTSPPTDPAALSAPLPTMAPASAKRYARQTLAGVLGQLFKRAYQYPVTCSRKTVTRFKCSDIFVNGPNDYYSNVTVYFVKDPTDGLVGWTDTYTIRWVNDQCYFHSGHPQTCQIHTRHGTW